MYCTTISWWWWWWWGEGGQMIEWSGWEEEEEAIVLSRIIFLVGDVCVLGNDVNIQKLPLWEWRLKHHYYHKKKKKKVTLRDEQKITRLKKLQWNFIATSLDFGTIFHPMKFHERSFRSYSSDSFKRVNSDDGRFFLLTFCLSNIIREWRWTKR